jgi:hypothetical protein
MPDDHSKLVPLLPIPNRTVKRLSADDSADSRVKVGHCQAITALKWPGTKVSGHLSFVIKDFIYASLPLRRRTSAHSYDNRPSRLLDIK